MTIEYERLLNWSFAPLTSTYSARDTMLYALSIGVGSDSVERRELRFVYERELIAFPTMSVVLGHPGIWYRHPDTGIDWVKVLHAEQSLAVHRPLPVAGTVVSTARVTAIVDKGPGKGAFVSTAREVRGETDGAHYATVVSTIFCRGDGGFGGPNTKQPGPQAIPERPPDAVCDLPTLRQSALLYRLNGDDNPLHADPDVAGAAGFKAPILHGLCTFGFAAHAILRTCGDWEAGRITALATRFSAVVYPGETLRTEIWRENPIVVFRTRAIERDTIVLNNGRASLG